MPKLERSLKRLAKDLGDNNAQAIARWGVQTCRELAKSTQAFGDKKTRQVQEGAITSDAYNVLLVVDSLRSTGKGYRVENKGKFYTVSGRKVLKSPDEVHDWIELNRTRRRGRTARLPVEERRVVVRSVFKAGMKKRLALAGLAKGGWIGAGQDIAAAQKGTDRINIGKSTHPQPGWSPSAILTNKASHVSSNHVLKSSHIESAVQWGLRKTLSWYRAALRRQNQKQKL
jgi:hypothetical protein